MACDSYRGATGQAAEDVFGKVCADFGATLVDCNGDDDHVHLLVEYPPTVAISSLVNSLKSVPAAVCGSDSRSAPTGTASGPRPTSPPRPAAHPSIIQQYLEALRRPA
jgi:putative transposase